MTTALQFSDFQQALRTGATDTVQAYLQAHPEVVHQKDARGATPLILAAYYDQAELIDLLAQYGADLDAQDASGNTALMGACFKGHSQSVQRLLAYGANANTQNYNGATALIFAVTFNQAALAQTLLTHGADATLTDARGHTAAAHARMQGLKTLAAQLE